MNSFPALITSIWRADKSGSYSADPKNATHLLFHSRVVFNESTQYTIRLFGPSSQPILEGVKVLHVRDKLFGDGDLPMSCVESEMIDKDLIITTTLSESHPRIEVDFQFFVLYDKALDQIATLAPEGSQPFSLEFVKEGCQNVKVGGMVTMKPEVNAAFLRNEMTGTGCYYGTRL